MRRGDTDKKKRANEMVHENDIIPGISPEAVALSEARKKDDFSRAEWVVILRVLFHIHVHKYAHMCACMRAYTICRYMCENNDTISEKKTRRDKNGDMIYIYMYIYVGQVFFV